MQCEKCDKIPTVRGLKRIKCLSCGKFSLIYANAGNYCHDCSVIHKLCYICNVPCDEYTTSLENIKGETLFEKELEVLLSERLLGISFTRDIVDTVKNDLEKLLEKHGFKF